MREDGVLTIIYLLLCVIVSTTPTPTIKYEDNKKVFWDFLCVGHDPIRAQNALGKAAEFQF